MLFKNYALLFFLSINLLIITESVDGLKVVSDTISEDGLASSVKKTIKTKYGDVIDCFDINRQPAFNHPLLKNHKIQKTPNFPTGWTESSSLEQVIDLQHLGFHQQCPEGTVPIRRNPNKMSAAVPKTLMETLSDTETEHVKMGAAVRLRGKDHTRYTGARARIEIHNPKCKLGETSSANIWFLDDRNKFFSLIVAGWEVNPTLYGDEHTHFTTFWADRIYDTGCYNIDCPGFVQIDGTVPLGMVLPNVSLPDGSKYFITFHVFQDEETKNWWLHFGETNTLVGYWPEKIFSHFSNGSAFLDYGGFVEGIPGQPEPAMGSGIVPDGASNYKYVGYFSDLEYIGQEYNVVRIPLEQEVKLYHNGPYDVEFHPYVPGKGASLLYGGPNSMKGIRSGSTGNDAVKDM